MQELAKRLDVSLEMVIYDQPGQVADDATQGVWDIAILAIEKIGYQVVVLFRVNEVFRLLKLGYDLV